MSQWYEWSRGPLQIEITEELPPGAAVFRPGWISGGAEFQVRLLRVEIAQYRRDVGLPLSEARLPFVRVTALGARLKVNGEPRATEEEVTVREQEYELDFVQDAIDRAHRVYHAAEAAQNN